jgi:membrane protein required for colicin V production
MNILDAIIAIPLLFGAWMGFRKGLIYELAMIAGLIAGVYLGFKFSGLVYDLLKDVLPDEGNLLHILSFLIVFAAILLIFIFYAKLMEAVLKITSLNMFNKVAGAVLGVFKFALAVSVIFWLLKPLENLVNVIPQKSRDESMMYGYVLKTASFISPVVQDVKDEFRENFGATQISVGE